MTDAGLIALTWSGPAHLSVGGRYIWKRKLMGQVDSSRRSRSTAADRGAAFLRLEPTGASRAPGKASRVAPSGSPTTVNSPGHDISCLGRRTTPGAAGAISWSICVDATSSSVSSICSNGSAYRYPLDKLARNFLAGVPSGRGYNPPQLSLGPGLGSRRLGSRHPTFGRGSPIVDRVRPTSASSCH
jgi:hypothetical protein